MSISEVNQVEIKQLITFKVAAENLNFTQTVKMLNFVQSSVTSQFKALEEEIGKPLFERLGKVDQIEFASIEAIKQNVIAGLGMALLPEIVVKREIEEGKMKTLPRNATLSPFYTQIAWHKDKRMTLPLEAFIDITHKTFVTEKLHI